MFLGPVGDGKCALRKEVFGIEDLALLLLEDGT
jgi:hypothetical protein